MGVLDDNTKVPLGVVVRTVGAVGVVIFAWTAHTQAVADLQQKYAAHEEIIKRLEDSTHQIVTSVAVISAKQDTAIERIDRIGKTVGEMIFTLKTR